MKKVVRLYGCLLICGLVSSGPVSGAEMSNDELQFGLEF